MIGGELGPQEQIAADQFRRFYAALLELRDTIRAAEPGAAPAARAPGIDTLRLVLAQAIADLGYRHDELHGQVPVDTGYVMTAVADEVLLMQCHEWADCDAWADRPLEAVLYGSRLAGDRIFEAAEDLVARRRSDPRAATAILLALLTGFQGRYRGGDGGRIRALEEGLYALVCGRVYAPEDRAPYASPDLAATTLPGHSVRGLPALWPWLVAILCVALAYLPFSHAVWWQQVASIDTLADAVIAHDPAGTGARTDR